MQTPPAAVLLRIEGAAEAVAALAVYAVLGESWWLFAALVLAPDLSFLAYLAGPRVGAVIYNSVHMTVGPAVLVCIGLYTGTGLLLSIAAIWMFHIGWDRALGYGLKGYEGFEYTHLGPIGRLAAQMRTNSSV